MGRHSIRLEEDCSEAWTALEQRGGPETLAETLCWSDVFDLFPSRQRIEAARREGNLPGDQLSGAGGSWRASRNNFVAWLEEMRSGMAGGDAPSVSSISPSSIEKESRMRTNEWLRLRDAAWKLRMASKTIRRAIEAAHLTAWTDNQGRVLVSAHEIEYILNRRPGQPTLAQLRQQAE